MGRTLLRSVQVFCLLFSLGLLVTSVVCIQASLRELNTNRLAANWPEATAKVTRAWVKTITAESGTPSNRRRSVIHEVNLDYSYSIDGSEYKGQAVAPRQPKDSSDIEQAEAVAASYRSRPMLQIFYNPANPLESRASRTPISSSFWLFVAVIGVVNLVSGSAIIWYALFRLGRTPASA